MPPCRGNDSLCFQAPQLLRNVCAASRTQTHQRANVASSPGFLPGSAFFYFVFRVFILLSCSGNKEKQTITKKRKEKKRLSFSLRRKRKGLNKQKVTGKANKHRLFAKDPDGLSRNLSNCRAQGYGVCGAHQSATYTLIPNPTGHPGTNRGSGRSQTSLKSSQTRPC